MAPSVLWIELLRLAAQLGGAVFVAWLTVRWALRRYKTEKLWDRKLQAIGDVIAALSVMRRINSAWLDEERDPEGPSNSESEYERERAKRYRDADWRVQETAALATMLWPGDVSDILENLRRKMQANSANLEQTGDVAEALEADELLIDLALEQLRARGAAHVEKVGS